ncbi:MAG: efflux RND transporter periplasmic adaptor subunit [Bacteroidota bacterium]|nr:efflux RND transporter periplasmic adaptor subunit [Bacteroidota bacterium]
MKIQKNIIIVLAILVTGACNQQNEPKDFPGDSSAEPGRIMLSTTQVANAGITYGQISKHILSQDVHAQGQLVVPHNGEADIVSFCDGVISTVIVQIGSYVKQGQHMAIVTSPEFIRKQTDYLAAKSKLDLWDKEHSRQETLNQENVSSEKQYQKARASYLEARTEYNAIKMEVRMLGLDIDDLEKGEITDKMILKSPLSGYVDEIFVNVGKYIKPGETLFKVIDRSKLFVELMIFEKDIMSIKPGQRVEFSLANLDNVRYEAQITAISSKVSSEAKVVKAIADFKNTSNDLLPGMFVSAKVHTKEDYLDALPEDAIIFDGQASYFIYYTLPLLLDENEVAFQKVEVDRGFVEDGFAQITLLDSIPANAQVVIQGAYYLRAAELQGKE